MLAELGKEVDLEKFFHENELAEILKGIVSTDMTAPEPQIEKAAELQKKWQTARGQIWEIGVHLMMCGDSTNESDVSTLLSGHRPDLCVTDPPYGVNYDAEWRNDAAQAGPKSMRGAPGGSATGKVTNDDRCDWSEAWRLFPGNILYVWHGALHATQVAESLTACGFDLRSQIVWAKQRLVISRGHYHWQHEPCWYAVRGGETAKWKGDRSQTTLWQIEHSQSETGHSTQKPVECMARPMRNHEPCEVYDPFVGSGTTLCAAQLLGRTCYAMEIEPRYVAVCLERMSAMGLEPRLAESAVAHGK